MRRSLCSRALPVLAVISAVGSARAQTPGERRDARSTAEAARFLLVPAGARMVGMGGAVVSSRGEVEGVLWNPATIAGLEGNHLFVHLSNDFGSSSQVLGGVLEWRDLKVGLTYYHFDLGSIEARGPANQDLGTLNLDDAAFIISVARRTSGPLDVGLNYKLLRLGSSCSGPCEAFERTVTGHAFDLGFTLAVPGAKGTIVGAVLRNVGPSIARTSDGAGDPLPTRLRAGLSLPPLRFGQGSRGGDPPVEILLAADVQETVSEFDDLDAGIGAEASYRSLLYVRGGYAWSGEGRSGPSLGFGLRSERFRIDFGRAFDDFASFDEDSPFQLSLSFRPSL